MPEVQISGSITITIPFRCECGTRYEFALNGAWIGKEFECGCGQAYQIDANGHVWKVETQREVETDESEPDTPDHI